MKIQYFILIGMSVLIGWSFYMIANPTLSCNSGLGCANQYLDYVNPYLAIIILGTMFIVFPTGLSLIDSKKKSVKPKTDGVN